jgi:predicted deacylase
MDRTPVTHRTTTRQLGRLPSSREIEVTVHRYVGRSGPTVYVQAAQHGIELNGPAALRRLHDRLCDARLAGEVVVVPVANPLAFDARSYLTPAAYDARAPNMNRRWPGEESGSLGERFVARLWGLIEDADPDAVVDLHAGTPDMLPHVRHGADDETARRLAEAFGTPYRLAVPDDADSSAGKFRVTAARTGVSAITAELANSRTVSRPAAETGADGVERVLQALDLLAGTVPTVEQTPLHDEPASVRAAESGLFEPADGVAVGERLSAGERLGTVYDPAGFESLATPTVTDGGVVYSLARGTVVAGERLAALGAPS